MGEGGIAPDYFLHRMQWWEVNRYLAGLYRRHRTAWENTRALQWFLARMFGDSKKNNIPNDPQSFYKFAWEEDITSVPSITDDEFRYEQELMANLKI